MKPTPPAIVACAVLGLAALTRADDASAPRSGPGTQASPTRPPEPEQPPARTALSALGLRLESEDGTNSMHLWFRAQLRLSTPFNSDPRSRDDFAKPAVSSLDLQRIRVKLDGHAYRPWLHYYFEYDFKSQMLDVQLTLTRLAWLQLRVGQWKVTYNRERVDSSGKQQFVDRSIVNREFTLDRQPGLMLSGQLMGGKPLDLRYVAGVFNGNGSNAANDDDHPMWMTRLQWSPLGRQLPFSQSDIARHPKPAGTIAFGAVTNRSRYTRFATSGAGQLDGFEPGSPGRYSVRQYLQEAAFMYRGFSFQQEWHWKRVSDNETGLRTALEGAYAQAGVFPSGLLGWIPRPLELALRWAFVDPDRDVSDDTRHELTLGANWFFAGHDNKLTADVSRLELEQPGGPTLRDYRFRLQWDVSF